MTENIKRHIAWILSVGLVSAAEAQTPPDAGSIFQQLEKNRPKQEQRAPAPIAPESPATQEVSPSSQQIVVKQFKFTNNTRISTQELETLVRPYLNHPITFSELQNAAADVTNLHEQRGWLVHTLYPEQDITNGEITMQVIEASWGGVTIHRNNSRVSDERITNTIEQAIDKNSPLLSGIDRGLNLVNELPGVQAKSSLQKGGTEQTVQMRLDLSAEPLAQTNLSLDNQGSRSTGQNRVVGQITLNSLNAWADRATLTSVHSQGMDYTHVAYSLPIGYQGLRLGISTSGLHYKVVEDDFSSIEASGKFQTQGLDASYPLIRNQYQTLNAFGSVEKKEFQNKSADTVSNQYNTRVLTVGFNGLFVKPNNMQQGSISKSVGLLRSDTASPTNTRFEKINYAFSSQHPVGPDWRLTGSIRGQYSKDALDSSEKFYLGGPQGIRAYPANEAGASNGRILSIEFARPLSNAVEITGFYDWGKLFSRSTEVFAAQGAYILRGPGVGLKWKTSEHWAFEATWAHRIGNNPNPTGTGSDQDGTTVENRFWFRGSLRF